MVTFSCLIDMRLPFTIFAQFNAYHYSPTWYRFLIKANYIITTKKKHNHAMVYMCEKVKKYTNTYIEITRTIQRVETSNKRVTGGYAMYLLSSITPMAYRLTISFFSSASKYPAAYRKPYGIWIIRQDKNFNNWPKTSFTVHHSSSCFVVWLISHRAPTQHAT